MTSNELTAIDDNRCLAHGCRCLYTINGHLCQRCYWQRQGQIHAGWYGPLSIESEPTAPDIHAGWHDLSIVDECETLLALQREFDASRRAANQRRVTEGN